MGNKGFDSSNRYSGRISVADVPPSMAGQYCLLRLVNQYGVLTERLGGCLQNSLCLKEPEGFDSPTRLDSDRVIVLWCNRQHNGFWYRYSRFES